MNDQGVEEMLQIAGNAQESLLNRIQAIKKLDLKTDSSTIMKLKQFLERAKPASPPSVNWDPAAADRVVDLYVLEALHKLGDDSQIDRIGRLVAQAGTILQGPDEELYNASIVIKSIGRKEPVKQLIGLAGHEDPQAQRNAVITLNKLKLSHSPVGGSTGSALSSSQKFTYQFTTLKEELEIPTNLSKGKIQLSEGVKTFLKTNDYDRGNVTHENITLPEIVERDLAILDFDYFMEKEKVVICTHQEAGRRWQEWWIRYHDSFKF